MPDSGITTFPSLPMNPMLGRLASILLLCLCPGCPALKAQVTPPSPAPGDKAPQASAAPEPVDKNQNSPVPAGTSDNAQGSPATPDKDDPDQSSPAPAGSGDAQAIPGIDPATAGIAAKSDDIFLGILRQVTPSVAPGTGGALPEGVPVKVLHAFRGKAHATISVALPPVSHEVVREAAPEVGGAYIFFAKREGTRMTALKMLPATGENITAVMNYLVPESEPAVQTESVTLTGSELKTGDVVLIADAIFIGETIDAGIKDPVASHPGTSFHALKVRVSQSLRGFLSGDVSTSLAVSDQPHETAPQAGGSYIFFVTKSDQSAFDPFTVVKLLPATADTIAAVKSLIAAPPPPQ